MKAMNFKKVEVKGFTKQEAINADTGIKFNMV